MNDINFQRLETVIVDLRLEIPETICLTTLLTGITQNKLSPFAICVSVRPGRTSDIRMSVPLDFP